MYLRQVVDDLPTALGCNYLRQLFFGGSEKYLAAGVLNPAWLALVTK
jgi:hypothetical protein